MKFFQVVHLQLSEHNIVMVVFANKKSEFNLLIPFSGGNVLNFTKAALSADLKCFYFLQATSCRAVMWSDLWAELFRS